MNDYIGKHRPKTLPEATEALNEAALRDLRARVMGNDSQPRHSAAHRPERAA